MRLNLSRDRFEDRRQLLAAFNRAADGLESADTVGSIDKFQDQTYRLLLNNRVANAFELAKEDPRVVASYDTSGYARPDGWNKTGRGKHGYYTGQARIDRQAFVAGPATCARPAAASSPFTPITKASGTCTPTAKT